MTPQLRLPDMNLTETTTPRLILDLDALDHNIKAMAGKARRLGVSLRPHIKTHKCVEIGRRQLAAGAVGITVSTLYEARVFSDHGFDDITWAFPIPIGQIESAGQLSDTIALKVVADSKEAVRRMVDSGKPFEVLLKIDTGYHRAGLDHGSELILQLAGEICEASNLRFAGILSHCGHSYDAGDDNARAAIAEEDCRLMAEVKNRLGNSGIDCPTVSVGSTPSVVSAQELPGATEVRPGNYALFDYTGVERGICEIGDCAATVQATVISTPEHLEHCVVDAGALALSKDPSVAPDAGYGKVPGDCPEGCGTLFSLSQEHGKVDLKAPVGSMVTIIPNHSCLTVACHDEFVVVQGGGEVDCWKIWRGR